jgi:hypothetical protein
LSRKKYFGIAKEHRIPAGGKFAPPKKPYSSRKRFQSNAQGGKKLSNIFKRFLHGLLSAYACQPQAGWTIKKGGRTALF